MKIYNNKPYHLHFSFRQSLLPTKNFPQYSAIASQIQRSAISIPSNIAEGSSRSSSTEFARYLEIAIGSAFELETQIELSYYFQYLDEENYKKLISDVVSVEKRISTFISKIRSK